MPEVNTIRIDQKDEDRIRDRARQYHTLASQLREQFPTLFSRSIDSSYDSFSCSKWKVQAGVPSDKLTIDFLFSGLAKNRSLQISEVSHVLTSKGFTILNSFCEDAECNEDGKHIKYKYLVKIPDSIK